MENRRWAENAGVGHAWNNIDDEDDDEDGDADEDNEEDDYGSGGDEKAQEGHSRQGLFGPIGRRTNLDPARNLTTGGTALEGPQASSE